MYVGRLRDEFAAADGASLRQFERSPVQLALLDAAGEVVFVNASFKVWLAAVAGRHNTDGNLLQVMAGLLCRSASRAASGRWSAFLSGAARQHQRHRRAAVSRGCSVVPHQRHPVQERRRCTDAVRQRGRHERLRGGAGGKGHARQAAGLAGERAPADLRRAARLHGSASGGGRPQSHAAQIALEGRCGHAGDPERYRAVGRQRDTGAARLHLSAASARSRERRTGAYPAALLRGFRAPHRPCPSASTATAASMGSCRRRKRRSCASSRRR